MKQQYQTRYELLHENYQKWLTGFTRHAVSWGVCHPNIYYFHNLTPGWVSFNGEKPEIAIVPQSLHRLIYGPDKRSSLNNQNQLIAGETLFTGTINRTEVHPREVIKRALYHNAAAVVLAHNHPSGEVTPSKADRLITERLVQALGLVDIRVPDHLIVGGNQVFSFAEHGLL
ncbi:JAB domain-containing protein [Escherichia coli]|uniref:JAB domain-containing protein n=1 Tax=Escherichia coli TaxID=562 RepID=UPI003F48769B